MRQLENEIFKFISDFTFSKKDTLNLFYPINIILDFKKMSDAL